MGGRGIRRRFCSCPAGERQKQEAEDRLVQAERQAALAELLAPLRGYERCTFARWDINRNAPHSEQAVRRVADYVGQATQDGKNWLYLSGGYGQGKTHLAAAAVRKLAVSRGWRSRLVVWPELCQLTQESWSADHGPSEDQLWSAARSAGVLLLDDLDKTHTGEWAMSKLFALVNYRSVRQTPTIITANHSLLALQDQWRRSNREHVRDTGMAVLSRIAGQLWGLVEVRGVDQRWG